MHYELKRDKQKNGQGRTGVDPFGEINGSRINLNVKFGAGMGGKPDEWEQNRDPS